MNEVHHPALSIPFDFGNLMTPTNALIGNLLSPAVLAFILGLSARLIKGDLSLPKDAFGLIAAYLLFAIGLKGGVELAHAPAGEVAGVRLTLSEANPSYSLTCSLGITFPFNILAGIPLYFEMASWIGGQWQKGASIKFSYRLRGQDLCA